MHECVVCVGGGGVCVRGEVCVWGGRCVCEGGRW